MMAATMAMRAKWMARKTREGKSKRVIMGNGSNQRANHCHLLFLVELSPLRRAPRPPLSALETRDRFHLHVRCAETAWRRDAIRATMVDAVDVRYRIKPRCHGRKHLAGCSPQLEQSRIQRREIEQQCALQLTFVTTPVTPERESMQPLRRAAAKREIGIRTSPPA